MLRSWDEHGHKGTNGTCDDTATLALHVITSAGFGISYPFQGGLRIIQKGHTMLYREALSTILNNIVLVFLLPHKLLSPKYVPLRLSYLSRAVQEYKNYLLEMVDKERDLVLNGEYGADNLMSSLVRASEEDKATTMNGGSKNGLSDDEVLGNLFIYNFAGHETTANTLAFAILLLGAFPEQQEWIREEIEHVIGRHGNPDDWTYETNFPRLKRCLAVMVSRHRIWAVPRLKLNSSNYSMKH